MAVDDSYSKALLHMDGTDASTTFTDESGKTWTANGNAQIDTAQSMFGGASGLFDGSGDYLTTSANTDFDFGTGDFTIDLRIRFGSLSGQQAIFAGGSSSDFMFQWNTDTGTTSRFGIGRNAVAWDTKSNVQSLSTNTWYHLAVVRSSGVVTFYLNGTGIGGAANTTSYSIAGNVQIGKDNSTNYVYAWIDELRVSKGIARWTTSFTPSNFAYGDSGTVDDSYTKILLHMDGVDGSNYFKDETGKQWTVYGNSQIDNAQSKFGGTSGYFDGTGDYITTPDSDDFNVGNSAFTIDFWARFTSTSSYRAIYTQRASSTSNFSQALMTIGGKLYWEHTLDGGTAYGTTFNTVLSLNTWMHIAIVRYSGFLKCYINGTAESNSHNVGTDTIYNSSAVFMIGNHATDNDYFYGWMDEFRFSKGIARWTANFTPPSSPYGEITFIPHVLNII